MIEINYHKLLMIEINYHKLLMIEIDASAAHYGFGEKQPA